MRRSIGIETFDPLGDGEHFGDPRVGLGGLLQPRLVRHGLFQTDRMGRVLRHEFGEPVDLAERHFQHSPDVAHDAARQEGAEGDDLRHPVGAVALAHIGDHLVAPVLAEVDVKVRHRHALGVEEALEQQSEAHRVEIGDGERPRGERTCARAPARSDWNAMRLRPFDEVGDDEEIAGELHLDDDVELEGEPALIVPAGVAGREAVRLQPRPEAFASLAAQFLILVDRNAAGNGKARQDGLARQRPKAAAHRNFDAGLRRLGEVGEQRRHLGAGLEPVLRRQPAAVGGGDERAFGDAEQRVVRLIVGAGGEIGFVGRHQRRPQTVGEIDQLRFDRALRVEPVTLELDVEPGVENPGEARETALGEVGHASR